MSKQDRDRLEDFFRKGIQNYNFEYNENDWKKLEAKLDQADKGTVVPFWKSNGLKVIGALIAVAGLVFWLWPETNDGSSTASITNIAATENINSDLAEEQSNASLSVTEIQNEVQELGEP